MKTIIFILLQILPVSWMNSQTFLLPVANLTDLDGFTVSTDQILKPGQPTIMVFWDSGDAKCCQNLDALQSVLTDQLKDKNIRIVAICSKFNGIWPNVKPLVYGKGWDFDIYIDVNGEFSRCLQINGMPFTMLFNENRDIGC